LVLTAENLMKANFHLRQNSCKFGFVTQFGTVVNSVDPIYSPEALFLIYRLAEIQRWWSFKTICMWKMAKVQVEGVWLCFPQIAAS